MTISDVVIWVVVVLAWAYAIILFVSMFFPHDDGDNHGT
jgi:hypothetical protein